MRSFVSRSGDHGRDACEAKEALKPDFVGHHRTTLGGRVVPSAMSLTAVRPTFPDPEPLPRRSTTSMSVQGVDVKHF